MGNMFRYHFWKIKNCVNIMVYMDNVFGNGFPSYEFPAKCIRHTWRFCLDLAPTWAQRRCKLRRKNRILEAELLRRVAPKRFSLDASNSRGFLWSWIAAERAELLRRAAPKRFSLKSAFFSSLILLRGKKGKEWKEKGRKGNGQYNGLHGR